MRKSFTGYFMALLMVVFVAGCGSNGGGSSDTTAPTVTFTSPANAATGVAINSKINATFSEAMDPARITTATFTLKETVSGTTVTGTVDYVGTNAIFTPAANLERNTDYTATITTGAKDLAGNGPASNFEWTFKTGATEDTTAPTVTGTINANGATNVPINTKVGATFSEGMDPLTITNVNFLLKETLSGTAVTGTVSYSGVNAVFIPLNNLTNDTTYTATIKGGASGAKDLAGNALAADKVWSWTTVEETTPPTVASTVPVDLATGVAINATVNATFSEAMDPATITISTFTLAVQGGASVTGAVGYNALTRTATFTPAGNLASATYTATITTGVKDPAGNALAADKVWSFTTGSAAAAGPAPVNLGTAGNYVILAKTGVSTTGTTAVVGDIGLSPAAASYITGFGLIADSTNTFSTSSLVTGKVYASNYAVPTPTNMTTAVSDMQTAFTDAAGRTLPDFTELGAGDISGMTLVPGLYKWGTGVLITNAGVTLSGGANDVWIFQIAQNLTVNNSAIVTLIGGAQAKNIFWQVSGQATLGTAADFKGIILSQSLISLNTGAVMKGRALAQTAVTLNATAITAP